MVTRQPVRVPSEAMVEISEAVVSGDSIVYHLVALHHVIARRARRTSCVCGDEDSS